VVRAGISTKAASAQSLWAAEVHVIGNLEILPTDSQDAARAPVVRRPHAEDVAAGIPEGRAAGADAAIESVADRVPELQRAI